MAPSRKVSRNHSTMPQRAMLNTPPVRCGWRRSAAKTPNWQGKEVEASTIVLTRANGTSSLAASLAQSSPEVARSVKYIAKRPAKNINSLESHTTVPTETRFGRFRVGCAGVLGAWVAVVTRPLCLYLRPVHQRIRTLGEPPRFPNRVNPRHSGEINIRGFLQNVYNLGR